MEQEPQATQQQYRHRHANPVGAVIFIILGVLLLSNNLGWLPWSTWDIIWRFWPVIFVIWGLQMMLGRNMLSRVIISIISLIILLTILLYVLTNSSSPASSWLMGHYTNMMSPNYISYPHQNWD